MQKDALISAAVQALPDLLWHGLHRSVAMPTVSTLAPANKNAHT